MVTKTLGTREAAILVNPNLESVAIGQAVIGMIMAQAVTRPHLRESIKAIGWTKESGVQVEVTGAGERQHLANALGFAKDDVVTARFANAGGRGRTGSLLGMAVLVWNVE